MPGYAVLMKYTPQGLANIKESPERIKQGRALVEKLGGRVVGVWVTMGEYDLIAIGEFPNDQAVATWALSLAKLDQRPIVARPRSRLLRIEGHVDCLRDAGHRASS